jgi:formamidopyrimidine-DNA glycosylase
MPELPEVETIRRALEPALVRKRIRGVDASRPDIIGHPDSVAAFTRAVAGRRVERLRRKGKYLILALDRGRELVIHLRLSGHLEVVAATERPRYERLRLLLSGSQALSFCEPRVLGRAYAVEAGRYPPALRGMTAMGPEPISDSFTTEFLRARLRGRRAAVKSLLLDQRVCCGVGNIYSDEALFRAGLRPTRRAGSLKAGEVGRLAGALRSVLTQGIRWCGTTMADQRYLLPDGASGGYQQRLAVFGRTGQPCRECGQAVLRTRIGNRSSHYCPRCQK